MKKVLFPITVLMLILVLTMSGTALAAKPLAQASGGGTVDWGMGRVTYGFIAQQIDERGNARGEAQFFHRDLINPFHDHADVLYLAVDSNTGDAWIGAVITQSSDPSLVGREIYWRVQDNGEGKKATGPDKVSTVVFGAAVTALSMPPLGLIDWTNGNVKVKGNGDGSGGGIQG